MNRLTINDEVLCAFMDGELDMDDLHSVRQAIDEDPALAERLAALTTVDALVRKHAHALDQRPLPDRVLDRLNPSGTGAASNVIRLDYWRRSRQFMEQHARIAAALVVALGLVTFLAVRDGGRDVPGLPDYADSLASTMSGDTVVLEDSTTLVTRFSFRDDTGRYCRQYRLQTPVQSTENVACRDDRGWTVVASLDATLANGGEYRPASQLPAMEALLDDMMEGDTLSLTEERELIRRDWQSEE